MKSMLIFITSEKRVFCAVFHQAHDVVKLTIYNALIILAIGMMVVITGAFMKIQNLPYGRYTILGGLAIEFLGTVWFVLSLYLRRKNS